MLYSPIPRIAKQVYGFDKVYISNKSQYRSPLTKAFVWERNPYIDGFSDKDAYYPEFSTVPPGSNILDEIAVFYGLSNERGRLNEPEIYYKPVITQSLTNATIFEPNSINHSGVPTLQQTQKYFNDNAIRITHQMVVLYKPETFENFQVIYLEAGTLERLCDIVASCKMFYCYTTGIATLAAAIGKSVTVLYTPEIKPMFHHSKFHSYINILE